MLCVCVRPSVRACVRVASGGFSVVDAGNGSFEEVTDEAPGDWSEEVCSVAVAAAAVSWCSKKLSPHVQPPPPAPAAPWIRRDAASGRRELLFPCHRTSSAEK